jgi:hypothetical protein
MVLLSLVGPLDNGFITKRNRIVTSATETLLATQPRVCPFLADRRIFLAQGNRVARIVTSSRALTVEHIGTTEASLPSAVAPRLT